MNIKQIEIHCYECGYHNKKYEELNTSKINKKDSKIIYKPCPNCQSENGLSLHIRES